MTQARPCPVCAATAAAPPQPAAAGASPQAAAAGAAPQPAAADASPPFAAGPALDDGKCPQCGGRLVDEDDLPPAARRALAQARAATGGRALACPACRAPMAALDSRGVLVDRCAACRLVWLDAADSSPGQLSLGELALFALSMPERAARGVLGGLGGAVHEAAQVLVPRSLRRTELYRSAVQKGLRFLVEDVGGVAGRFEPDASPKLDAARAAVGGFLDTAGMALLHASPLWLLAAFSDLTRGSKTYLRELSDELVRQGVLPPDTSVERVEDLLGALERFTAQLARGVDQPPLSVDELRASLAELKREIAVLGPDVLFTKADLERTWQALTAAARREGRSLFEVSSAVAIASAGATKLAATTWASVAVGADLLYAGVLKHYLDTLAAIDQRGYWVTVASAAAPYLGGAAGQLESARESFTERLLSGRLLRDLWGKRSAAAKPAPSGPRASS